MKWDWTQTEHQYTEKRILIQFETGAVEQKGFLEEKSSLQENRPSLSVCLAPPPRPPDEVLGFDPWTRCPAPLTDQPSRSSAEPKEDLSDPGRFTVLLKKATQARVSEQQRVFQRERVLLAAGAALAPRLMTPGMRLLSTSAG